MVSQKPIVELNTEAWRIASELKLADPPFYHRGDIDVFSCAEFYFDLLQSGRLTLKTEWAYKVQYLTG